MVLKTDHCRNASWTEFPNMTLASSSEWLPSWCEIGNPLKCLHVSLQSTRHTTTRQSTSLLPADCHNSKFWRCGPRWMLQINQEPNNRRAVYQKKNNRVQSGPLTVLSVWWRHQKFRLRTSIAPNFTCTVLSPIETNHEFQFTSKNVNRDSWVRSKLASFGKLICKGHCLIPDGIHDKRIYRNLC